MFQSRTILRILTFLIVFPVITIGSSHAQQTVNVTLQDTPTIIDGAKQNSLEVRGRVYGSNPRKIVIQCAWSVGNTFRYDESPPLQRDQNGNIKHTFSIGGNNCGFVQFKALVWVSDVVASSEWKGTYVDCDPPRILINKPGDGEFIKPRTPVRIEAKVEDDTISRTFYILADTKFTLKIDVDGSTIQSYELPVNQLRQQPVRLFNIPGVNPGQHAIRLTLTDPSGKSDEKTIFVKADGTPPSVRITSPGDNDRITFGTGSVPSLRLTAEATDESGIERVEFYVNGQGVGLVNTPSDGNNKYTRIVGISEEGEKTIMVRAYDKMGNHSQSSTRIFVNFEGKPKAVGPPPSPSKPLPEPQKTLPR